MRCRCIRGVILPERHWVRHHIGAQTSHIKSKEICTSTTAGYRSSTAAAQCFKCLQYPSCWSTGTSSSGTSHPLLSARLEKSHESRLPHALRVDRFAICRKGRTEVQPFTSRQGTRPPSVGCRAPHVVPQALGGTPCTGPCSRP
jgi:hypothetical protein